MWPRRPVALVLALAVVLVSAAAAYVGAFWGFTLTCDDSCSSPPPWREDSDAWQWSALGWSGIAGFAFAVVCFLALALRRRGPATVATLAWIGLAGWFIVLFGQSGLTSNAHRGWIGLAVTTAALVAAIASTPPRRDQADALRS